MLLSRSSVLALAAVLVAFAGCGRDPKYHVAKGDQYVTAKKFREATIEYKSALQKDPRLGDVRMKLSDAYVQLGDLANAVLECQRGADLLPNDPSAQLKAGQLLLVIGRYEEARARARKVLDKNPLHVEAQVLFANALAGVQDLDGALKEIEQAIALDPQRSLSYANLGAILFTKGSREQAETAFRNAVAMDPKSLPAHLALANFLWATDRPGEAEASLQAALALDPRNLIAHRALATLYLASRRSNEAEQHLKAAAEASSEVGLQLVLADYYILQKRNGDAMVVLERLAKTPDGFGPAETRIAVILSDQGKRVEAHRKIDEVLRRQPGDAAALVTKGRLLLGEGQTQAALQKVRAAVVSDPRYAPAHYLLGLLLMPEEPDAAIRSFTEVLRLVPRAGVARLELAQLHLRQGNPPAAVQFATEAVRLEPRSYDAHAMLARALTAAGDFARAEQEVGLLQAATPDKPETAVLSGTLSLAKNDFTAAAKSFERANELAPGSFDAIKGLTAVDVAARRFAEARRRLDTCIRQTPRDARLHMLAAEVAEAANDPTNLENELRAVLEADPNNFDAYVGLARLYFRQQRLAEAQREFEASLKSRPTSVGVRTMLGMTLALQGRTAEARACFEKVIEADPRAPVAANNLAWIYSENGENLDIALQLAQTAVSALPNRPEINDTLGWIYYKKGLAATAIAPLLRATEKDPDNATYQFHAGMALAKAGDKARAKQRLEAALALNPNFAEASEARQKLASLK